MCFRHLGFIPRSFRYKVFGSLLSRLDRRICVFKFSPGISLSVCSCSASSSGFVRIGTYFPSRLDMSYTIGVPVSSGISSSSSSSSSSLVSLSARFLFWTIFNLPFRMSRRISSQRPYFPSSPHRQCRFFVGFISPVAFTDGSFLFFLSVWNSGPEIIFQFIIFPVSIFLVLSVPLSAVWILL